MPLVLVRMPTYRRPDLLKRAIACLQAQSHEEWICEVRDDCPDRSARQVVEEAADTRVRHIHNRPQKFMVKQLDDCFLRENPYGADYFYMLEDDNQILPEFFQRGIDICEKADVNICQINQAVEFNTNTPAAHQSKLGTLDSIFDDRAYQPDEFRLAVFGGIGISNGAVFWSKKIKRELAIHVNTIPTLEEYLRTALVDERVYICLDKLALWAKNEETTTRNLGLHNGWLRRELDLKKSINTLRRSVWAQTPKDMQQEFLMGGILKTPMEKRHDALERAGIPFSPRRKLGPADRIKRAAVRHFGREHPSVLRVT